MNRPCVEIARKLIIGDDAYLRVRPFKADRPDEPSEVLLENRIWFSDIGSQDDIFEGRPRLAWRDAPPTLDELREIARRQAPELAEENREAFVLGFFRTLQDPNLLRLAKADFEHRYQALYQASSVACFFRDLFGVRSWADYADRGRGYGLVFDLSIPWNFEAFPQTGPSDWVPFEVNYVPRNERPTIELAFAPSDPEVMFEQLTSALLTKSNEWQDQKEERFVRVGIPGSHVTFPEQSLKGLILGHAIENNRREQLIDIVRARQMPIAVFETRMSDQHIALELKALDM